MVRRAGFRRRGAAALVDLALALVVVQGLAAVGFAATGGRVTTSFALATSCSAAPAAADAVDLPRGDTLPAGFVPQRAALCRSSVLGLTTGLAYVLSRIDTHAGLDVTTVYAFPVDLAWRAAGGRLDLAPFLLPLFALIRWAFDRFAGATPGRWLARIRVAEAESAGARVGTALGAELTRRYVLFARPCFPILAVGAAAPFLASGAGSASPALAVAGGIAVAIALASQAVAAAAILDGRSTFYERPSATLVAGLADLDVGGGAAGLSAPRPAHAHWGLVALSVAAVAWFALSRPAPVGEERPAPVAERGPPAPPAAAPVRRSVAADAEPRPLFDAATVALRSARAAELAARAEAEAERGQSTDALADLSHAISMKQGVAELDAARDFAFEAEGIVGRNLFTAGDLPDAVAVDGRALALRSGDARILLQRAVAEFFMAEQPDALADLDAALLDGPRDAEAALWREIVARRLGRPSRLDADAAAVDMTRWPAPILDLFRGWLPPEALRSTLIDGDLSKLKQRQCAAEFFTGEWHVLRGEADPGRDALRDALRDCPDDGLEAHEAEDELLGRAGFR